MLAIKLTGMCFMETIENVAQSLIDWAHDLWVRHQELYKAGYAVLYSPVRLEPDLLLIGLNPGGDGTSFNGMKETLRSIDEPMEYWTYRADKTYPLAGRTVALFGSIDQLDLLKRSVKINMNFFRSTNWSSLPSAHRDECKMHAFRLLDQLHPKVIFCESLMVFDETCAHVRQSGQLSVIRAEVNRAGKRIYAAMKCQRAYNSVIIIGIKHLTGSWPSNADMNQMTDCLARDLA